MMPAGTDLLLKTRSVLLRQHHLRPASLRNDYVIDELAAFTPPVRDVRRKSRRRIHCSHGQGRCR